MTNININYKNKRFENKYLLPFTASLLCHSIIMQANSKASFFSLRDKHFRVSSFERLQLADKYLLSFLTAINVSISNKQTHLAK